MSADTSPAAGFRVRRARAGPADVGSVDDPRTLARLLAAFDDEFETPHDPEPTLAGRFRRILGTEAAFALLGLDPGHSRQPGQPGQAVGFALVTLRPAIWFDGPVATLDELYVRPDRRGQGLGALLLAGVRTELEGRGCPELHVNVDEVDADARRFYERHGLVNVEREQDGRMLLFVGPVESTGLEGT